MYQYSRSFKRPYNLTIDIGAGGQTDVSPRSPIAPQPSPLTPRQRSPLTPLRSSFRLPPRSPHRPTPQSSSRSPCSVRTTSTTFFNPTYDSDAAPSSAGIEEWDRTYDSDSELIALEQEVNYNMSTFNSIVSGDVRTEDMTLEQIGQRFFEVSGYQGRPKQLEAIHIVACQRKALILIARTSFGKSLVFNMLPLLHPVLRGIVLVVIPLKHIARQQWERVNLYDRAKAFVYDKDHKSKLDRQRIAAGVYTHGICS